MDCIKLGHCNYISEFEQTEQDISEPCVMNVRQTQQNHYNSEAATPENVASNKFWRFVCEYAIFLAGRKRSPGWCHSYSEIFESTVRCETVTYLISKIF